MTADHDGKVFLAVGSHCAECLGEATAREKGGAGEDKEDDRQPASAGWGRGATTRARRGEGRGGGRDDARERFRGDARGDRARSARVVAPKRFAPTFRSRNPSRARKNARTDAATSRPRPRSRERAARARSEEENEETGARDVADRAPRACRVRCDAGKERAVAAADGEERTLRATDGADSSSSSRDRFHRRNGFFSFQGSRFIGPFRVTDGTERCCYDEYDGSRASTRRDQIIVGLAARADVAAAAGGVSRARWEAKAQNAARTRRVIR